MTASGYIDAIRILPLSLANAQIEDFCGISNFFRDADSFCYNQYVDRFKKAERDEYGDWQTSMRMALSVCRLIKEKGADPKIIVEPTCGKGHFILAALQTFDNIEEIYGIEIHEPYLEELKIGILQYFWIIRTPEKLKSDCFIRVFLISFPSKKHRQKRGLVRRKPALGYKQQIRCDAKRKIFL